MAKYIKVFSNIALVKGASRGLILDLQRNQYKIVSLVLIDFFSYIDNKPINKIFAFKSPKITMNDITTYYEFIIKNEYAFECNSIKELNLFPKLEIKFSTPYVISNLVLKNPTLITQKNILKVINELNIPYCLIIFKNLTTTISLKKIFDPLSLTCLRSIQLILQFYTGIEEELIEFIKKQKTISYILIFNSFDEKKINISGCEIVFTKRGYLNLLNSRISDESYFRTNIHLYNEANFYNPYLNGKMFIDSNGNIHNSHETKTTFGNINKMSLGELKNLIESKRFRMLWSINKNMISICKDCEFRYVCVDNRIPSRSRGGVWHHKIDCEYNPYTGRWLKEKTN